MDLIYWSIRSSSKRDGDGVKGFDGGNRYFSQMRVLENMVQHSSNYIQIHVDLFIIIILSI